ncbi:AraC family transcriptional regulator [Oxalobacteraceae bacterium A2-2]
MMESAFMFSQSPKVEDPLSEVVRLLRPHAAFANVISGKGNWAVRYAEYGLPSFCIMLEGSCLLAVDGHEPIAIGAGDFILLPATPAFTLSSFAPAPAVCLDPHQVAQDRAELRYGDQAGEPDMRSLGGAFLLNSSNAGLLLSLLPAVVHVRDSARLSLLVRLVREESAGLQPGAGYLLSRLAEMLLVEAMRCSAAGNAPPGLLRGLADARLAPALQAMHGQVHHAWTIDQLASIAALSRTAFFERFARTVGATPMDYLLAWRMEIAKELLTAGELTVSAIAERVGYGSSSAFSVAFSRYVGLAPSHYVRSRPSRGIGASSP